MKKKVNKLTWVRLRKYLYTAVVLFLVLSIFSVIFFRFIPVPFTPLVFIRSVEQLRSDSRDFCFEKDWVSLEEISPNMVAAVIVSEDQRFVAHNGFDFDAIEKAIRHNRVSKKQIGASTISQQTAKNVFLWNGRNWLRKGLETYFTLLIETIWPKDRILEVYLNVIEFGDGIYGVEAAAQHYYHKPAATLNRSEAAMLAAILPNPLKWNPNQPDAKLKRRQNKVLRGLDHVKNDENIKLLTSND